MGCLIRGLDDAVHLYCVWALVGGSEGSLSGKWRADIGWNGITPYLAVRKIVSSVGLERLETGLLWSRELNPKII